MQSIIIIIVIIFIVSIIIIILIIIVIVISIITVISSNIYVWAVSTCFAIRPSLCFLPFVLIGSKWSHPIVLLHFCLIVQSFGFQFVIQKRKLLWSILDISELYRLSTRCHCQHINLTLLSATLLWLYQLKSLGSNTICLDWINMLD